MDQSKAELLAGNVPSDYVTLKAAGSPERYGNAEPARSLRQLTETGSCVARPPMAGEREALEAGVEVLRVRRLARRLRGTIVRPAGHRCADAQAS
jgi:hypothetical protein